jgi:hypothetical protein
MVPVKTVVTKSKRGVDKTSWFAILSEVER